MITIVFLTLIFSILYLVYEQNKLKDLYDELREDYKYVMREIEFQDEWVEMDFDVNDVQE